MTRNRLIVLLAICALLVVPVGAQDDDEVFRVGAVLPSATNDLAFSQSMYDALVTIQEEMGEENFEFLVQDGTYIVDDAAVALRDWAASGEYDLVIGHGSQYGSVIEELAVEFPDVSFAWGTEADTFGLDNVYGYRAASNEGAYVQGVLAANLTETGVIGIIGSVEVGDGKLFVDGFTYGVNQSEPDVTVNTVYINSFSDVPLATETANTHLENGADILTGSAQMVVGPIAVARDNEILWFGNEVSQSDLAGEAGVLYQVYDWAPILETMIANIQEGELGGEAYSINLENGGLDLQFDPDNELSDEMMALFEETVQGIIDGEIETLPYSLEAEAEATEEATEEATD